MTQPEMQPLPRGPRRELGGRHISPDDIDLPPIPPSTAEAIPAAGDSRPDRPASARTESRRFPQLWMAAALIAALATGGWLWQRSHSAETAHSNWKHVTAAADASVAHRANVVVQRNSAGAIRQLSSIEVSQADADPATTQRVRELLLKNDLAGANAALQAAQPEGRQAKPALGPNTRMLTAIGDGSAQFFHLRLFDCCVEDGDAVDISIDGEPFETVRLTNEGVVISVPLIPGTTVITLRGVSDGGDKVTVSFETSQGDFFCRPMEVGEEFQVGVIVK